MGSPFSFRLSLHQSSSDSLKYDTPSKRGARSLKLSSHIHVHVEDSKHSRPSFIHLLKSSPEVASISRLDGWGMIIIILMKEQPSLHTYMYIHVIYVHIIMHKLLTCVLHVAPTGESLLAILFYLTEKE